MTITTVRPEVGSKLKNGAILLAYRSNGDGEYTVLACHAGAGAVMPFATWRLLPTGETIWGHYFSELFEAVDDYARRP